MQNWRGDTLTDRGRLQEEEQTEEQGIVVPDPESQKRMFTEEEKRKNYLSLYRKKKGLEEGEEFCRICERTFQRGGDAVMWRGHVKRHKIAYCESQGLEQREWQDVKWEAVVRLFNPRFAEANMKNPHRETVQDKQKREGQQTMEAFMR